MSLSPDLSGPDIRTAPLYRKPEGWPSPDKYLLTRAQAQLSMDKLQILINKNKKMGIISEKCMHAVKNSSKSAKTSDINEFVIGDHSHTLDPQ